MKCICGFLLPTEGKVIVNGKRLEETWTSLQTLASSSRRRLFAADERSKELEIIASLNRKIGLKEIAASIRRVG
jgi:ABC-2 type transport system ATP-binding protein